VAQLALKISKITPFSLSPVYLYLVMLTPVLPSWFGRQPHFPRAPLIHVYHRRHDGTQDVRHALRDDHRPRTSAGTTIVLKSVQAPRVAVGKHGRQSLLAACNCSDLAGRLCVTDQLTELGFLVDTGADLCVYPRYRLPERRTQTSYELFAANGAVVHTHNPAFGFRSTTGVFMVFCRRGPNGTHHRLRLSLLL